METSLAKKYNRPVGLGSSGRLRRYHERGPWLGGRASSEKQGAGELVFCSPSPYPDLVQVGTPDMCILSGGTLLVISGRVILVAGYQSVSSFRQSYDYLR